MPHDPIVQPSSEETEQKHTVFLLLRMYWSDLIKLNLLFVLCSLPIVTIPAAVMAMNRVVLSMIFGRPFAFTWKQEFFGTFKKELFRSFCVGVPVALVLALCLYGILSAGWAGGRVRLLFPAVSALALFSCLNVSIYLFAILSYLKLTTGQALRNALLLLFAEFLRNLLCDVLITAFTLLMVATFPFLAPLFLFGYFSYLCFFLCCCIRPGLERCTLQPVAKDGSNEQSDSTNLEK